MKPVLTPKQRKALEYVAKGYSIEQAADEMCISKSTLEKHIMSSKGRLNATNLRHAIYLAAKQGLIVWCCVTVYDADDIRRSPRTRLRRRDDVELTVDLPDRY